MDISLTTGVGHGPTPLAAFDTALLDAGVANYNLIYLSSVIPPDCFVVERKYYSRRFSDYGRRLYCVMSRENAGKPGEMAVAGLGWTQAQNGSGLFVEIHGHNPAQVRADITSTLRTMIDNRGGGYGSIHSAIAQIECVDDPVCAIACAVYMSVPWEVLDDNVAVSKLY